MEITNDVLCDLLLAPPSPPAPRRAGRPARKASQIWTSRIGVARAFGLNRRPFPRVGSRVTPFLSPLPPSFGGRADPKTEDPMTTDPMTTDPSRREEPAQGVGLAVKADDVHVAERVGLLASVLALAVALLA